MKYRRPGDRKMIVWHWVFDRQQRLPKPEVNVKKPKVVGAWGGQKTE